MTLKLTKTEMARLVEISRTKYPNCGRQPVTTKKLIDKGLVRAVGGSIAKTGRIMQHPDAKITDAGNAILTSIPPQD